MKSEEELREILKDKEEEMGSYKRQWDGLESHSITDHILFLRWVLDEGDELSKHFMDSLYPKVKRS